MAPSLRRCAARSTLVSHLGAHHGDRSFLLVRERPRDLSAGECLALHGIFDMSVQERLHSALLSLPHSHSPLVLDLRGIRAVDEGFLLRLLKMQRELVPQRSLTFQIADSGPVLPLIQRLGLEARFGLEPTKRQPLKRSAVSALAAFPVSRPDAEKSINRDLIAN